jgi:transcriptional regulator with XRE-family HTH domain
MRETERFAARLHQARQTSGYWAELAKQEFAEGLRQLMGEMTQREFAARLGEKSTAFVSRLLAGRYNLTIQRMNEIVGCLGGAAHVTVTRRDSLFMGSENPQTRVELQTDAAPVVVSSEMGAFARPRFTPEAVEAAV